MDGESKIHIGEGVPLNSTGAANIYLNTGNKCTDSKNSHNDTVIHIKTDKPSDIGLHINTTFSLASSKKIKFLFILNFLLSFICVVLSSTFAYYYWKEMVSMRRQLDLLKDNILIQNLSQDRVLSSALVAPKPIVIETQESKQGKSIHVDGKKYFVEDLGEDMYLVDMKKKNATKENDPGFDIPITDKELLVAQFNGAVKEVKLQGVIGPWKRDMEISSKNSANKIELNQHAVTIKESGLYLVYAQIVWLTQSPNCFFVWARMPDKLPRLLSTCATGNDSTGRELSQSQISCSVQTIARLYDGDVVTLSQREANRTLWLRPGYSYFGFVKLSS